MTALSNKEAKAVKSGVKSFRPPRPDEPRLLAYNVIREVNQSGGFANLLLPRYLQESDLEARDKGFVTELVYGTLRMQGMHDWIIEQVIDREFSELDPGIVDVLRLGIHQLFHMRVPVHAGVSATVELARKVVGESKATYVNAILRKISARELEQWLEPLSVLDDLVARYAIEFSHPEWIVSAYFDLLKDSDEVRSALTSNNIPASPTLGDEIYVYDASGTAGTYNITLARNSNLINGNAGNFILDVNGSAISLSYTGSTYGWKAG